MPPRSLDEMDSAARGRLPGFARVSCPHEIGLKVCETAQPRARGVGRVARSKHPRASTRARTRRRQPRAWPSPTPRFVHRKPASVEADASSRRPRGVSGARRGRSFKSLRAFEPRARHHGYQDDRAPAAGDRHARVHGVRARRPRRLRRLDGRQGELSAPHGERATPRRPPRRDSKNSKHALTTETRPSCPSPRLPRPSPDSRSCQTPDSRLTRARLRPDLRPDRRTMSPSGAR